MKAVRIVPGPAIKPELAGAVLVRDLTVGGARWPKGRRLSSEDVACLRDPTSVDGGPRGGHAGSSHGFTVLVLEPGDVHEDEAALRLAAAVAGPGLVTSGPNESRVDLRAEQAGILHVRIDGLERLNRIDPLEVFTLYDGQSVAERELVASVKIGPHAVAAATLDEGVRIAARSSPLVRVAPFVRRTVAIVVKESMRAGMRKRFEETVFAKVEPLGSTIEAFHYVPDQAPAVTRTLRALARGPHRVDVVLTAGAASTDPRDPFFQAIETLDGSIVRHGVPAHPGSMVWLARIGSTDLLGLPTCGAYSKATAADLILPRLLTGERVSATLVSGLGHGGVLTRSMRFRFPPYARDLAAPEG